MREKYIVFKISNHLRQITNDYELKLGIQVVFTMIISNHKLK